LLYSTGNRLSLAFWRFQNYSPAATYNNKRNSADLLKVPLNKELADINTAKTLITKTLDGISKSNSSEEVLSLFNDYQNTVDTQNLPTQMTGLGRDAEYQKFKMDTDAEFATNAGGSGEMALLQAQCEQIRQQMPPTGVYSPPSNGGL
jgi:hypothetical protein